MRVLHLGINYWPDETGIAPFATERCEYLAASGHKVVACTGLPYYPQWSVPASYRGRLFQTEHRRGVKIVRCWMYVPSRPSSLRRVLHEASFVCSSLIRAVGVWRPDLIFVASPPLALGVTAVALSRLWGVPYVFHVADLQPDAAVDLGMLDAGTFVRTLYWLENFAYRHAALVSTLTEAMRDKIVSKGIAPEKVALFSDWVDPVLFTINQPHHDAVPGRQYVVAHFGNMGVKQGLGVVIDAASESRLDTALVYRLVGDGAARRDLEERARALDLQNVEFLPLQPRDRFMDLLGQADACLVTQQQNVADIVFPSKVITLLAAARPVIASVAPGSEVARVLRDSHAGLVVAPEDPRALRSAVEQLRSHPQQAVEMGLAGRAYALKRWDREVLLSSMEQMVSAVASDNGPAWLPTRPLDPLADGAMPALLETRHDSGQLWLPKRLYGSFSSNGQPALAGSQGAIYEKSSGHRRRRLHRPSPGPVSETPGTLGSGRRPDAS